MIELREKPVLSGITPEDLRNAVLSGGDASTVIPVLRKALGKAPFASLASLEGAELPGAISLLEKTDLRLAEFIVTWLEGKESRLQLPARANPILVGLPPFGRNVRVYLEKLMSEVKPDVVALDVSPLELRTSLAYAFSVPAAVGVAAYCELGFRDSHQPFALEKLYPGSTAETATLRCWLDKIPLIPVGFPRRPGDSVLKTADVERQDEEMSGLNLEMTYHEFDESLKGMTSGEDIDARTQALCSPLKYSVSESMSRKWELESRYCASRIIDLVNFLNETKQEAKLLVLVDLKHYLGLKESLEFLGEGIREDIYISPRASVTGPVFMLGHYTQKLNELAGEYSAEVSLTQEVFADALSQMSLKKQNSALTLARADRLISEIGRATRAHPEIQRGVSVRGTIATREVFLGLAQLHGLKRGTLEKAVLITMPYRIQLKPGLRKSKVAVIGDIVKETLYDIHFYRRIVQLVPSAKGEWLSAEEINQALERLKQEKLENEKLLKLLEAKGLIKKKEQDLYVLTQKSVARLMANLERMFLEGSITREKYEMEKRRLEAMLPRDKESTLKLSSKDIADLITDFMGAIDSGWEKEWGRDINFLRMHTYYEMLGDGKSLGEWKKDYYQLKAAIDDLEKRGMLKVPPGGGDRSLSGEALRFLLEYQELRDRRLAGLEATIATSRGKIRERSQLIRRYTQGDVFRDISPRHTMKEVARQGKSLTRVNQNDLRVHLKSQRKPQSDIVFCIDTSGSMAEKQKLIFARVATALLARTAVDNGDRVGVVAFQDLGQTTLPLTDESMALVNDYIVALHALGATNIGDGIKVATDLLIREANHNRKHIVLITDGEPNAVSEKAFSQLKEKTKGDVSQESALVETRRAAAKGIRLSVIYLTEEKKTFDEFVKGIARSGKGKLMMVRCGEEKG
ncbi:MAG: VWA domain-containing protein [Chloroflexota bacterium]